MGRRRNIECTELPGERARIVLFACVLAGVALTLAGRLAYLQVGAHAAAAARVAKNREQLEPLPPARSSILDRTGRELAHDRPVYEAWGEAYFPLGDDGQPVALHAAIDKLVSRTMLVLARDTLAIPDSREADRMRGLLGTRLRDRVTARLARLHEKVAEAEAQGRAIRPRDLRIDFPIHLEVVDADAIGGLRELDVRRDRRDAKERKRDGYRVYVHLTPRYERVYADSESIAGIVGFVQDDRREGFRQVGIRGLERLAIARPGAPGARAFGVDASSERYWSGRSRAPDEARRIRTTLDLDLQRVAQKNLEEAVAAVAEHYGSPPEWGALMAVDVATGDLLAIASFQQKAGAKQMANEWTGAFAATEFAFEPGSVVKPLVLALGAERGAFTWDDTVECAQPLGLPIGGQRRLRVVKDTHQSGTLNARGVLINSSNIGAVQLGLRLGPDGLDDYLARYALKQPIGLPLPVEPKRRMPAKAIKDLDRNEQQIWTGPSLCFGYGLQTTVAHLARAYLTLVSRRPRELRLIDAIEVDGAWQKIPPRDAGSQTFLSGGTLAHIVDALIALVDGADGATAQRLTRMLRDRGVAKGLIAGKTGTSEFKGQGGKETRTASFAGFAPADAPRVLVVCVIQKIGAASFFGGTYAAPAAGRVLLEALTSRQHRHNEDGRVSASSSELAVLGRATQRQEGR